MGKETFLNDIESKISTELDLQILNEIKDNLKLLWRSYCIIKGLKEKLDISEYIYSPYIPLQFTHIEDEKDVLNDDNRVHINKRYS